MYARSMEDGAHHVMQKALNNRTLQHYGFIIPWQDATAN